MAQRNSKYDRQLRIWGEHGQAALERASVCVINCGPTGSEALKNLVLGGIGSFTIVDSSRVEASDLGNNFFVDSESLGQSRGKCVSALLEELNESVEAKYVEKSGESLLHSDPDFFSHFTIVIATQMQENAIVLLDNICRQHGVMLVIARSYGLAGLLRISTSEHDVVESKPDSTVDDLRLYNPWPELRRYVDHFDVDTKDTLIHRHIPFAVILIKAAEEWKATHGGLLPSTAKERAEFKAALLTRRLSEDEENYKEALASAYKVWSPPKISSELRAVLEDKAVEVTPSSSDFWILVRALKLYMENEGKGDLPLDGGIPDMHSITEFYVKLQHVYQSRAEADVSAVETHTKNILRSLGRDSAAISRSSIKQACKNARNLRVVRYLSLAEEFTSRSLSGFQHLLAADNSNATIYILLRAVDHFAATYRRFPGLLDEELENDIDKLKVVATRLLSEIGICGGASLYEDYVVEFCRFGAGELHCVGSVIGGIASQEVIKLITGQFTPLLGTLLYNAITSTSSILKI